MKLRIALASVAIVVAVLGATWLVLGPLVSMLFQTLSNVPGPMADSLARWRSTFGLLLALNFVVASGLVFLVLYLLFGVPLARAGETVERIAEQYTDIDVRGGALLARLDGSLRRLAAALRDERERNQGQLDSLKASNAQLVRLQAELVAADRLATVGKLASGVAHEVGNPLAGILGYLSVIRMRAKGNAELGEVVERIEAEVQRIDQIVRALLELGRPSRGKAQPVDVRPLLDSCVSLLSAGREFHDVQVQIDAPAALWLRAESGPLSQVLVNLLINAAQAMGGKGRVTVRASEDGAVGRIAVEDEGPGLPADVLPRLFEPFFTTRPAGQGTGLGLAVSRHLLSQFEGTLEAANRPGGGAAFTITLPRP
jgi:two-component system NtrC family sensor kinase